MADLEALDLAHEGMEALLEATRPGAALYAANPALALDLRRRACELADRLELALVAVAPCSVACAVSGWFSGGSAELLRWRNAETGGVVSLREDGRLAHRRLAAGVYELVKAPCGEDAAREYVAGLKGYRAVPVGMWVNEPAAAGRGAA